MEFRSSDYPTQIRAAPVEQDSPPESRKGQFIPARSLGIVGLESKPEASFNISWDAIKEIEERISKVWFFRWDSAYFKNCCRDQVNELPSSALSEGKRYAHGSGC
jgi:hypothetical protein